MSTSMPSAHPATCVVLSAMRTPLGGFQGELASLTAPQLGAIAIRSALANAKIGADAVDDVLMGCVLPAGIGQAPARQAAIYAGLEDRTPCTTISKVCGSGMKAVMIGAHALQAGDANVVVAGGMESMTNAPYLLPKARAGMRLGHGEVKDHMFLDGLEDAYEGRLMGTYAEEAARTYQFTREAQDAYAVRSLERAESAQRDGHFRSQIAGVTVKGRAGESVIDADEQPRKADASKIPNLKPAFAKDGTVTAANSSSISDGAAALVLTRLATADAMGIQPIARIVGQASFAGKPALFTSAPVGAIRRLFEMTGWSVRTTDLFEVNEAFANVAMIAMQELDIPADALNIHGGACALGHPIGASGARILVTLIHALKARGLKRGVASLCIGGGEATAMAIELVH